MNLAVQILLLAALGQAHEVVAVICEGFNFDELKSVVRTFPHAKVVMPEDVEEVVRPLKVTAMNGKSTEIQLISQKDMVLKQGDALVLIGGIPGAENCGKSTLLNDAIEEYKKKGKLLAAICAAPKMLGSILGPDHLKYTAYQDLNIQGATYQQESVVVLKAERIITAKGPNEADQFAQAIKTMLDTKQQITSRL